MRFLDARFGGTAKFLASGVLVFLVSAPAQMLGATEESLGREVFEREKCGRCHSVASVEIEAKPKNEKMRGPDLGGYVAEEAPALFSYLRKEEKRNDKKHPRKAKSSDEDLQELMDWLASLEITPPP